MYYDKDIIMTGYAADYGAAVIAGRFYDELIVRLPVSLINRTIEYSEKKYEAPNSDSIKDYADYVWKISDGGVFKALRDMSDNYGTGISVWLDKISIRQETIEICEVYDINPYMLNGTGTSLIISEHGNELVRSLQGKGIHAAIIGHTTNNNDKIIINNNEIRYLESRIVDELGKLNHKGDE